MLHLLRRSLASGTVTSRYPDRPEVVPPTFRGMPQLIDASCRGDSACAAVCPTTAIQVAPTSGGWTWRLDRAACTGCGLCIDVCPHAALEVSPAFELAARDRADLAILVAFRRSVATDAAGTRGRR